MSWLITGAQKTDPDALAYLAEVERADGQALESGVRDAVIAFVAGCKADGIWNAIKASCILAGARTLNGALVPLVGTAPANVGPFVSGDYNRKTGLVGNGSTKYLNSNRANNSDPQNNRHMSVYAQSGYEAVTANNLIGSSTFVTGPGQSYSTIQQLNNELRFLFAGDSTAFTFANPSPTIGGFIGQSRSSSTTFTSRFNGVNVGRSSASVSSHINNHFVFCRNSDGNASNYSNARLAFYSIGESLDLSRLDARVTGLINAFAAAIP
ncbi:hypothetical protein SSRP02_p008 [Synechococcus phage S-SRP02]|nr:hypothetical protein SSRP02_p008 [Synechococcus phage S-SRP02]